MIYTNFDRRALTEVYNILIMLNKNEFEKIPSNIINAIYENMDVFYEIDWEKMEKGELLEDTENILSVIYTDYLATEEERDIILELSNLTDSIRGKSSNAEKVKNIDEKYLIRVKKERILERIFNKIKCFLKQKNARGGK